MSISVPGVLSAGCIQKEPCWPWFLLNLMRAAATPYWKRKPPGLAEVMVLTWPLVRICPDGLPTGFLVSSYASAMREEQAVVLLPVDSERRMSEPSETATCLLYTSDAADDLPCVNL